MPVPNPEQDAPLISLVLFQFLDPLIFKAYKVKHLPYDELPPLADYGYVQFLKEKRFEVIISFLTFIKPIGLNNESQHLDPFSGAPKRHIFFNLLRAFRKEWLIAAIFILVMIVGEFGAPIGLNRLLK